MRPVNPILFVSGVLALVFAAAGSAGAAIIFVDAAAHGENDGTSWADAYRELQSALAVAGPSDEIWVAAGVYRPDYDLKSGTRSRSRDATFQLKNGVALYGGLAGRENPADFDLSTRDFAANPTVLSGDLLGNDGADFANNADNSYHVVTASSTDATALLDGFTIAAGSASGTSGRDYGAGVYSSGGSARLVNCTFSGNSAVYGAGVYISVGSLTLSECTFDRNKATAVGGGIYNSGCSPVLTRCFFTQNRAGRNGGGMCNVDANPVLTACTFSGNSTTVQSADLNLGGGAISNARSNLAMTNCLLSGNFTYACGGGIHNGVGSRSVLVNCAFSGNSAGLEGGGLFHQDRATLAGCTLAANSARNGGALGSSGGPGPTLTNCIVWANTRAAGRQIEGPATVAYSCIQGGYAGFGNIDADPRFVRSPSPGPDGLWNGLEDDYGDLCLACGSPCLDGGTNLTTPSLPSTDAAGEPRVLNDTVDIGAYEGPYQAIRIRSDPVVVPEGGTAGVGICLACDPGSNARATVEYQSGDTDVLVESRGSLSFSSANYDMPQYVTLAALDDGDHTEGLTAFRVVLDGRPALTFIAAEKERDVPSILFVNDDAPGANDGTSWADAFNSLQDALSLAQGAPRAVDMVWVATGTYRPDRAAAKPAGTRDRNATFRLLNGVAIHGGFDPSMVPADFDKDGDVDLFDVGHAQSCQSGADVPQSIAGCLDARMDDDADVDDDDLAVVLACVSGPDTAQTDPACGPRSLRHRNLTTGVPATVLSGDLAGNDGQNPANSGENTYHVVTADGTDSTAVLDGFTISGGNANGSAPLDKGGGLFADHGSPSLRNCVFSGNAAANSGGGLYGDHSLAVLANCTFSANSGRYYGGGVFNSAGSFILSNCRLNRNQANLGGGMYNSGGGPVLSGCSFAANSATGGGGVFNSGSNPILRGCSFVQNTARSGGAMESTGGNVTLANCSFFGNSATGTGGGVSSSKEAGLTMVNCQLIGNSAGQKGGGLYDLLHSSLVIADCTFSANSAVQYGGGVCMDAGRCASPARISNCILWGNLARNNAQIHDGGTPAANVSYCDVQGGWTGEGNLNADPAFVREPGSGFDGVWATADDNYGDLHLQSASPCIDAGDNSAVPADSLDLNANGDVNEPTPFDLDRNPRFTDDWATPDNGQGDPPVVDMGAFELRVVSDEGNDVDRVGN